MCIFQAEYVWSPANLSDMKDSFSVVRCDYIALKLHEEIPQLNL